MITHEVEYIRSSYAQRCCQCGKTIPARAQSIKCTTTRTGALKGKTVKYWCMECEKKGAKVDAGS